MEDQEVDHHCATTWLHQGEIVFQLQQLRQQRHAMCPSAVLVAALTRTQRHC